VPAALFWVARNVNESHRDMSAEIKKEIELEIAHVLFIDIVAYSRDHVWDLEEIIALLEPSAV